MPRAGDAIVQSLRGNSYLCRRSRLRAGRTPAEHACNFGYGGNVPNLQLQHEELFEDDYTAKFEGLVRGRGPLGNFRRDRARLDVGLMLSQHGTWS